LVTQPDVNPYEYFAKAKGITIERAKAMHEGAAMAGKEAESTLILMILKWLILIKHIC
jgi:hypothetical protein